MVSEHAVSGMVRLAAHLGIQLLPRCRVTYLCHILRLENVEELQSLWQELQKQDLSATRLAHTKKGGNNKTRERNTFIKPSLLL